MSREEYTPTREHPKNLLYHLYTEDNLNFYRRKPKFVGRSYFSILIKELMNGRPINGLRDMVTKFLYENSDSVKHVMENPGGEKVLNDIYGFDRSQDSHTWLNRFFLGLRACEGTRRRKEEYQNILKGAIKELFGMSNDGLNIIDLGCGRGIVPMETIYEFLRNNGAERRKLHLVLVDRDKESLQIGKTISESLELSDMTEFKRYNARNVSLREDHGKYHIAGTHGLLDYFPDEEAIAFFRNIADILIPQGILITTNMTPHNDWMARNLMTFLRWILIYRTPREFQSLVERSGRYEILDTRVVNDTETVTLDHIPTNGTKGFHTVITARKKE